MRVKCIHTTGKMFPKSYISLGYMAQTEFDVGIGTVYDVYAMCLRGHCLKYLLDPHGDCCPNWYPANLFEIVDDRLPTTWVFAFNAKYQEYGIAAIWGYEEITNSPVHFDALAERDVTDLRIFANRKRIIDASV